LLRRYLPAVFVVFILTITPLSSRADVAVNLDLVHGFSSYYATLSITATSPDPITYHRVMSPSGLIWRQTNSGNSAPSMSPINDLNALIDECTNGLWTLTLNVGAPAESNYQFSVSIKNVTTNLFGDVTVIYPAADSTITTNRPNFQWSSTSLLPKVNVSAYDVDHTVTLNAALPGTATNWIPHTALAEGENRFYPRYSSNNYAGVVFSTPTNLVDGLPLSGWEATADIRTYAIQQYTITNPPPPIEYVAGFELEIVRRYINGTNLYCAYPRLSDTLPGSLPAEVESPNALCSGTGSGSSSSYAFATLEDAIAECEAGDWTLYYNRAVTNIEYKFTTSLLSIDTNVLAQTRILAPEADSTGLTGNPELSWSGPAGFSNLTVSTGGTSVNLPASETAWLDAPILQPGINQLSVKYEYTNHPDISISWPTNAFGKNLDGWDAMGKLSSSSSAGFTVATSSFPYYIMVPGTIENQFSLAFNSMPDTTFTIFCRTNLLAGNWEAVRSGNGTGAPLIFTLPATNPAAYYRIETQ